MGNRTNRLLRRIDVFLFVLAALLAATSASALLEIRNASAPASVPTDANPTLRALIDCDDDRTCIRRVCFRVSRHPEAAKLAAATEAGDYCVDLSRESQSGECGLIQDEGFVGILPMPEDGTEISYYFEVTEGDGSYDRSEVFTSDAKPFGDPPVEPAAITVYLTKKDAPERPPGFKPDGIVKFVPVGLTAAAAISIGGGANTGLIVGGVAAAAASAATVGAVAAQQESGAGVPPLPPPPVAVPNACFVTTPSPSTAMTPLRIFAGDRVVFDAECSSPDSALYQWFLGDDRSKQGKFIQPVFPTPGTWTVTLRVSNGAGEDTAEVEVIVDPKPGVNSPPISDTKPVACFTTDPTPANIMLMEQIRLDASCSTPGHALHYRWELGDGRVKQGQMSRVVNPAYPVPGTYFVTLKVSNTAGESVASQQIVVEPPPDPVAQTQTYTLSGGPSPTDMLRVDDVVQLFVQGALVGTYDPMGTNGFFPAVTVTAKAGVSLRIVARDKGGGAYYLNAAWLHPQSGVGYQLTPGVPRCDSLMDPCSALFGAVFFDQTFVLP